VVDTKSGAVTDLNRDIAVARAELRARCEQVVADLEERLRQLESLAQQLEAGALDQRAAQTRIRQLIHDRGAVVVPKRAGRTTIGLSVLGPADARPSLAAGPRGGSVAPTPDVAAAKAMQLIEQKIVALLTAPRTAAERAEGRLGLSLLAHLHRALQRQVASMPEDPVLLGTVVDMAEEAQSTVAALESGGLGRLVVLVDHVRVLSSELAALGGNAGRVKERLARVKALLLAKGPSLTDALKEVLAAHAEAAAELERCVPRNLPSWLDELGHI
jgi:hypothetical protein